MRFSLPSALFLSLLFTAKSFACVQFTAQIDFEFTNEAFVSARLVDEGGTTCWATQMPVDQTVLIRLAGLHCRVLCDLFVD